MNNNKQEQLFLEDVEQGLIENVKKHIEMKHVNIMSSRAQVVSFDRVLSSYEFLGPHPDIARMHAWDTTRRGTQVKSTNYRLSWSKHDADGTLPTLQ